MKNVVMLEEGKRGRDIQVLREVEKCTCCGNTTEVITIDISDGEYSELTLCQKCIDGFFKEPSNV